MIKNYLIIALRYIYRHKVFTFINIAGLTLGITCSLLILLFVRDELSYDKFHADADIIHRISMVGNLQGEKIHSSKTGLKVGPSIAKELAGVGDFARVADWKTFPIRYEDKSFTEDYLLLADKNFFRFFTFRLVVGHPDSVLDSPHKIVVSESAAKRYFGYKGPGDRSPLGKTLILAQGYLATVSGIAADPPRQSHFHFTHILSLSSWDEFNAPTGWLGRDVHTYLKTDRGFNPDTLEQSCNALFKRQVVSELNALPSSPELPYGEDNYLEIGLQPLLDIHLRSELSDEIEANGRMENVYIFSSVAFFITVLACINFMNLFTARSAGRSKEVGVRKAAGAHNARLIGQFMLESYLYIIVATCLSLFLILVLLGPFNVFTGKDISFESLFSTRFVAGALTFILVTGLLAGSYPAFYLTRFSPVEVLRGRLRASLRSYGIRNVLVVFQFFISTSLIICTLIVYLQLTYFKRADLGFDRSHVISLLHTRNLETNGRLFKEELKKIPGVVGSGYSSPLPPHVEWRSIARPEGKANDFLLHFYEMDLDHFPIMRFSLADGRYFDGDNPLDTNAVILNETAVRLMDIENPVGSKIFSGYDSPAGRYRTIIGVVKDFNFQSLKEPVQPLAIVLGSEPNWEMAIRTRGENTEGTIQAIKVLFQQYAAGAPFEYSFLDENFADMHQIEQRVGLLFLVFTFLAILIACLGLLGLATFSTEQRLKEIGIRKVLGSSMSGILLLLNKDFLKLILLANLIAWPVAGWAMNLWLDQFAYHVSIPWWTFAFAGLFTATIAVLSVSIQATKAAAGNPVNSLRNE